MLHLRFGIMRMKSYKNYKILQTIATLEIDKQYHGEKKNIANIVIEIGQ
jgi:hypothetical protein